METAFHLQDPTMVLQVLGPQHQWGRNLQPHRRRHKGTWVCPHSRQWAWGQWEHNSRFHSQVVPTLSITCTSSQCLALEVGA